MTRLLNGQRDRATVAVVKTLGLLAAVVVALTLTACGGSGEAVTVTVSGDGETPTTEETASGVSAAQVESCLQRVTNATAITSEEGAVSAAWDSRTDANNVSITFAASEEEATQIVEDAPPSLFTENVGTVVLTWVGDPYATSLAEEAHAARACAAGENPEPLAAEPPPPPPDPDADYTSNCDYTLGDFSESASGYRFLADARIRNTGNIGIVLRVRAAWDQIAAPPIREEKTVRLRPGQGRQVNFVRVVSQNELDLHQSVEQFPKCRVKATIIDTFGEAQ